MTIAEILSDESLRQREFPVTRDKIFLGHAGVCPLPDRVMQAVSDYVQQASLNDQESIVFPELLEEGRKVASGLLNCQPEEVAFVGPTSLGLSLIASLFAHSACATNPQCCSFAIRLLLRPGSRAALCHSRWAASAEFAARARSISKPTSRPIPPRASRLKPGCNL